MSVEIPKKATCDFCCEETYDFKKLDDGLIICADCEAEQADFYHKYQPEIDAMLGDA
jgi:hypothetical protein